MHELKTAVVVECKGENEEPCLHCSFDVLAKAGINKKDMLECKQELVASLDGGAEEGLECL
eukprot:1880059-Karenia_brevis.AAC.1